MGVNKFSDMTDKEFAKVLGLRDIEEQLTPEE